MLKIKDEIDLKELEKFGFDKHGDFYQYVFNYADEVIIDEPTRIIETDDGIRSSIDAYNDLLFDLIKATMVEKVEE